MTTRFLALSAPRRMVSLGAALLALGSAACWGLGLVTAKAALVGGVSPLALAVIQLVASLLILGPAAMVVARRVRWTAVARHSWPSGVLEYGISYALVAVGISMTSTGNAAIVNAAEPVLIAAFAALFLGERAGGNLLIALGLVTAGLVFVVWPDLVAIGQPGTGDLLVLASMSTGAIYAVLCRRLVAKFAPLPLALAQQVAGLVFLLLWISVAAVLGLPLGVGSVAAGILAALSGLLQHSAAVWLHLHALRRMPAGRFAIYLALVPVFALGAAYAVLEEAVTWPQLAGGALILIAALRAYTNR